MKPLVSFALVSVLAVSGCASGGGSQASTAPSGPAQTQGTGIRYVPFSIPLLNDSAIQSSLSSARNTQNSIGNVPTVIAVDVPVTVGLVDAPLFNLSQVNLAIERVNAISNLGTAQQTETALVVYPGEATVNVLNYQQSAANLGISLIPTGSYDAVELVVDPSNSSVVTTSGQKLPMVFGTFTHGNFSESTSSHYSLVFNYDFDPSVGLNNLLLDVNVENSLNVGTKGAAFGASLFAANGNTAGAIGGTIVEPNGTPVQNATAVVTDANGNLMGLAPTDQNGNFTVHALPAGTYVVTIYEKYVTAAAMTVTASDGMTGTLGPWQVNVPAGFEANIGTIKD